MKNKQRRVAVYGMKDGAEVFLGVNIIHNWEGDLLAGRINATADEVATFDSFHAGEIIGTFWRMDLCWLNGVIV